MRGLWRPVDSPSSTTARWKRSFVEVLVELRDKFPLSSYSPSFVSTIIPPHAPSAQHSKPPPIALFQQLDKLLEVRSLLSPPLLLTDGRQPHVFPGFSMLCTEQAMARPEPVNKG